MSWHKINRFELKAARQMLCLSSTEAAEHIAELGGAHPARSWQRWESGGRQIPDYLDEEVYALISQRNECIEGMIAADEVDQPQKWYEDFSSFSDDYPGHNIVWWRLHQSVLSALLADGDDIELSVDVETDENSYIYRFFSRHIKK